MSLSITEKPLGSGFCCLSALGRRDDVAELGRPVVDCDSHLDRVRSERPAGPGIQVETGALPKAGLYNPLTSLVRRKSR
jgi:hypothetical protein